MSDTNVCWWLWEPLAPRVRTTNTWFKKRGQVLFHLSSQTAIWGPAQKAGFPHSLPFVASGKCLVPREAPMPFPFSFDWEIKSCYCFQMEDKVGGELPGVLRAQQCHQPVLNRITRGGTYKIYIARFQFHRCIILATKCPKAAMFHFSSSHYQRRGKTLVMVRVDGQLGRI